MHDADIVGALKSELVWYSDNQDLFNGQIVRYSGAPYHGNLLFRPPFG